VSRPEPLSLSVMSVFQSYLSIVALGAVSYCNGYKLQINIPSKDPVSWNCTPLLSITMKNSRIKSAVENLSNVTLDQLNGGLSQGNRRVCPRSGARLTDKITSQASILSRHIKPELLRSMAPYERSRSSIQMPSRSRQLLTKKGRMARQEGMIEDCRGNSHY